MRSTTAAERSFRSLGRRARWHTHLRWVTTPLESVAAVVPHRGRVLDLGSGHGLLAIHLAVTSDERQVHAVDIDGEKLALGRRAAVAAGVSDRVEFEQVDRAWAPPPGAYDAVVVADVLYLLEPEDARSMLDGAARALRPGGCLVVKEMADGPRWKRRMSAIQEHVSVRLAGITLGDRVDPLSELEIVGPLEAHGLTVTRHAVGRGSICPHMLFVARRPAVVDQANG